MKEDPAISRTSSHNTLVLAWGNPGRLDDGLGPAFAEAVAKLGQPGVATEVEYQLQVEKAEQISRYRRVVFVDAESRGPEPFSFRRLEAAEGRPSFSTHSVSPESILALSGELFGRQPEAWLLGIRGYVFDDFGERLSPGARSNLEQAVEYLRQAMESGFLEQERGPEISPDRLERNEEVPS